MRRRRRWHKHFRSPRIVKRIIDVFYQILLPLIIFQLIRTLLLPTTFDVILLAVLVIIYLSHTFSWF
ncbi:hypothetical protein LGQ02_14870 [Bacillus shivajii]|uniref:hypothetical protein n=1 Tax=Bacillus shivajii TaxID=1983719 RepID=UPI001CFC1457|nr:hypothetical protein [Bacillus shivajii]UCZ52120.1 hypothetical protein LGQ02_14870 [Bacillus shivajii]